MEFEWRLDYSLIAILVGLSPLIVIGVWRAWKWYRKLQTGSNESLREHIDRIEKGG